jgi:hypothetical protein
MIKRLIGKLKTLRLYFVMFSYKDEYVQYGMCPGFTVWTNRQSCISGHMVIKKTDTKEQIKDNMIKCVSKICKDENLTEEQTVKTINDNLKSNGLI